MKCNTVMILLMNAITVIFKLFCFQIKFGKSAMLANSNTQFFTLFVV